MLGSVRRHLLVLDPRQRTAEPCPCVRLLFPGGADLRRAGRPHRIPRRGTRRSVASDSATGTRGGRGGGVPPGGARRRGGRCRALGDAAQRVPRHAARGRQRCGATRDHGDLPGRQSSRHRDHRITHGDLSCLVTGCHLLAGRHALVVRRDRMAPQCGGERCPDRLGRRTAERAGRHRTSGAGSRHRPSRRR